MQDSRDQYVGKMLDIILRTPNDLLFLVFVPCEGLD